MSRNSQHGKKLNKRWEEMERRNRERQGKQTAAPAPQPSGQTEPQAKIFHASAGPPP